jgi:bifunctional DNA-binding transcriptional regulator/antitoxin component of YhaV-PrlF toxin-antitoxin module
MPTKGNRLCEFHHTIKRAESQSKNINQYIHLEKYDEIEKGKRYHFEIRGAKKTTLNEDPIFFTRQVHDSKKSFTIPMDIIDQAGIKTGHTIVISIYEISEEISNGEVIDRVEVTSDTTVSDNCHAALNSKTVYTYLGEHDNLLKVRNLETNKETVYEAKQSDSKHPKHRFSFPISVRREISASPGDFIEVIAPSQPEGDKQTNKKDLEEKVSEMHEMISELYNAYNTAKND